MKAAIFDMDGTLADVSTIRHLLLADRGRKDFDAFHAASVNVPPHQWVADQARELNSQGVAVLVVTARKHKWRHHTAWFLALNDIPSDGLWMRGNNDHRRDYLIKADILQRIRNLGYQVTIAYDDNPKVIQLWQDHGIPTVTVPGWVDL